MVIMKQKQVADILTSLEPTKGLWKTVRYSATVARIVADLRQTAKLALVVYAFSQRLAQRMLFTNSHAGSKNDQHPVRAHNQSPALHSVRVYKRVFVCYSIDFLNIDMTRLNLVQRCEVK